MKFFRHIVMLAIVFFLAAVCDASAYEAEIKKMSATMAEKISATEKDKIAVVDFTDLQGDVTELGRFVAEEFSVALAGAGKGFKVVDRTHLKSIIKENKLSATGLIDPATARKLGKIVGVEALITGTLTPFGDSVRIAVKILDSSTAEVVDAISGNIAKTEAVKDLLATNLIFRKGPPSDTGEGEPGKPLQTVEAGGLLVQLMGGKLSNGNLTFSFLIISPKQDKKVYMLTNHSSRIFDYEGNEYEAIKGQIGYSERSSRAIEKNIIAGVPIKSSISFENIPPKITGVALLEVNFIDFTAQFHNISLSKRSNNSSAQLYAGSE
ncbi:MAG: FlgO family outer membrane protein [Candidatus Electrothrix sp. GW3-4]|uniref:FlgO family outer membrane protein n=1 Tax=Candidatus Electrothrix sp. GW3-4 TaxID=3126740 RepID=UPI0030D414E6